LYCVSCRGAQFAWATMFCSVARNNCGPLMWSLLYVILQARRISRWLLNFRKICGPQILYRYRYVSCVFCSLNSKVGKFATPNTDMRLLTTGIRSEKCVVRRFRRCANVIECTYTNLRSGVGNLSVVLCRSNVAKSLSVPTHPSPQYFYIHQPLKHFHLILSKLSF